ncbi:hypothetical protein X961_5650 [Burkholderia pseudomallei MSHR5613]|nr:hypothetical protein X961_5650 [Burkholderia pseudomallei MSHR5613]
MAATGPLGWRGGCASPLAGPRLASALFQAPIMPDFARDG